MLSNHPVTSQLPPVFYKKTLEEELRDPKSQLTIDMNNALERRAELLRRLKKQEIRYVINLKEKEEQEAEEEADAARRKEKQELAFRESLEKYYENQHQAMARAVAMGLVPLTTYQQLLTTVADHMLQLGTIATQLIVARTATQAAEAGYAQAVENQQRAGQAYVNAYFDTAYQTPMPLQGQPFTMDLNSTYGARLSPSERVHVEEHRQTSRERALAFAGSNPLDGVERLSADHPVNQQPQRYRSTIALNRRGYLSDIHELVPLSYEFAIVLQSQDELRQAVLSEHRSMINFARAFMLALRYSPSVTPQRREAEETNAAMVYAWERRANVRAEESRLQAAQVQMTASMGRLLDLLEGGNFMTFQQLREDSRRQEQPSFVPAPRSMGMSAPAA